MGLSTTLVQDSFICRLLGRPEGNLFDAPRQNLDSCINKYFHIFDAKA